MSEQSTYIISIIIPAYNAEKTIADCIDAMLAQDYSQTALEIIIVNDASTDNTPRILDEYKKYDQIKIVHHSENRALAAARNTGIRQVKGEICIFLDADIMVPPDFIGQHIAFYSNETVVGVFSNLNPDPEISYDKYQRYLYESRRGAKKYPPNKPIPFHSFLFTATSLRKSVIEIVGQFDDNIIHYGGEDTDYAYRISRHFPEGLFFAPHIKVLHKHHRSIDKVIENLSIFSQHVVPYLVNKHPEFNSLYGYSFVFPTKTVVGFFKKLAGCIIKSKTAFIIFMSGFHIFPFPISNLFVRLLLASALWQGMAQSKSGAPNSQR